MIWLHCSYHMSDYRGWHDDVLLVRDDQHLDRLLSRQLRQELRQVAHLLHVQRRVDFVGKKDRTGLCSVYSAAPTKTILVARTKERRHMACCPPESCG